MVRNILGYLPAIHPIHTAIHLMPDPFPLPFQPHGPTFTSRVTPTVDSKNTCKYELCIKLNTNYYQYIILYSTYSFHSDDVFHPSNRWQVCQAGLPADDGAEFPWPLGRFCEASGSKSKTHRVDERPGWDAWDACPSQVKIYDSHHMM